MIALGQGRRKARKMELHEWNEMLTKWWNKITLRFVCGKAKFDKAFAIEMFSQKRLSLIHLS